MIDEGTAEIEAFEEQAPEANDLEMQQFEDRSRILEWFERALHILNAYQSHQSGEHNLRMSAKCWQLALGYHLPAGAQGPAELARQCGVSKQAAGKCLNHFIEQLKLSPLPGQRKQEARENMAEARRQQVRAAIKLNPKILQKV